MRDQPVPPGMHRFTDANGPDGPQGCIGNDGIQCYGAVGTPTGPSKTEVEILRDTIEALTKQLERATAILKARGLDGIVGEASLPVEQKP